MSRIQKIFSAVTVVVLAAGVGIWWDSPNSFGVLVADEGSVKFWLTGEGKYQGTLVVRNIGDGHATIDRIDSGCGCTSVVASSHSLGPRDTCELTFDVSASSAPADVVYADLIRGLVRIAPSCVIVGRFRTGQRLGKLNVKAVAEVALPLALPTGSLDVDDVMASAGHAERAVSIRPVQSFGNVEAMSLAKGVVVSAAQSDAQIKLTVAVAPEEVDAVFRSEYGGMADIRLSGVVESGIEVSMILPLHIRVVPPVRVSPSRLIAGPLRAGESLTRELVFWPDGQSIKAITVIAIEGEANVSIEKIEPREQNTRATLRIDADAVKATDDQAVFLVTDEVGRQSRVTVPISVVVKL